MASAPALDAAFVGPEFAALIPAPTTDESLLIEESFATAGCRAPLTVIAGTNVLLDGDNRHAISTRLGDTATSTAMTEVGKK